MTQPILTKFKVMTALRKKAERYAGSHNPRDHEQANVLNAIADHVFADQKEDAVMKFDALHSNIKSSLPFEVLDYLDRIEQSLGLK